MISFIRVDNRLIHGQVVEAWLPHLKVERIAVADDEAAGSLLIRAAMGIALQSSVEVMIEPLRSLDYRKISSDKHKTMVLLREVGGVVTARELGLDVKRLNLGNVHFSTGRKQISSSVFLGDEELHALQALHGDGVDIEVRAVPSDKPILFDEMVERFKKR